MYFLKSKDPFRIDKTLEETFEKNFENQKNKGGSKGMVTALIGTVTVPKAMVTAVRNSRAMVHERPNKKNGRPRA